MTEKKPFIQDQTRRLAPLHGTESATRGVTFQHLFNLYCSGDANTENGLKLTTYVREAHKAQIDSKTRAQKWQCSKTEKEIRETFFGLNYDLQHP